MPTANEGLTAAYLQRTSRYNYFATAITVLLASLSLLWLLFSIGGESGKELYANLAYIFASFLSGIWVLQTVYWERKGSVQVESHYWLGWFCIGFGILISALASAFYAAAEYTDQTLSPSFADIIVNCYYPMIFVGLLMMPRTIRFRLRIGLDALITTLSIVGLVWYFIIGPLYFGPRVIAATPERTWTLVTLFSYPIWDLVFLFVIVLFILHRAEPITRSALLLVILALSITFMADLTYAYQMLFGEYQKGSFYIDGAWIIGSLLFGLSALYQHANLARRTYRLGLQNAQANWPGQRDIKGLERLRLPNVTMYILPSLIIGLAAYAGLFKYNLNAQYLIAITAIVGSLMVARYLFATHENEVLLEEREKRHDESERLRQMMTQLTKILEIDELLREIVNLATSELGFDAVMLLLLDQRNSISHQSPRLLVHAATLPGGIVHWNFQGESALQGIVQIGKPIRVQWDEQPYIPKEIQTWQKKQNVPSMQFLPLTYQDKNLGSLGVFNRSFTWNDTKKLEVAQAFTEQVAIVVEHARLYKEAREHETFSQGMANIAARLNAVVVEPDEINKLICSEGAYILHADYALLYVAEENQLVPLAVYTSDTEPVSEPDAWPTIMLTEYEAQAMDALQPTLLHVKQSTQSESSFSDPRLPQAQQPSLVGGPSRPLEVRLSENTRPLVSTRKDPHYRQVPLSSKLAQHFIPTAILAPLIARGNSLGLLLFARTFPPGEREKQPFTASDLSNAQDFVEQAVVAFANAQLYQHLHTAHQQLKELDQLKDQFITTASHELRTPLTAVQGYIELMAQYDEILPPDQRRDFLEKARRGCEELVVMLGNVMDASRLEVEAGIRPALLKRVAVQETIESILILIEPQLKQEERPLYVNIPSRLFIQADPARFRQVLMNLCVNALKYSPPKSPISITARVMADRMPTVTPSVVISIADKGKGIAPDDQKRLFQRFVRLESDVNSPVRGSGLGLYISRRLIEAMGGRIWVESKGHEGEGSIFSIMLPQAR